MMKIKIIFTAFIMCLLTVSGQVIAQNTTPACQRDKTATQTTCIGSITLPSGTVYVGELKGEIREGRGISKTTNGTTIEGYYKNDLPEGEMKVRFPDGSEYIGPVINGTLNGIGLRIYPNGSRYFGMWKDGKPSDPNPKFMCPKTLKEYSVDMVKCFYEAAHLNGGVRDFNADLWEAYYRKLLLEAERYQNNQISKLEFEARNAEYWAQFVGQEKVRLDGAAAVNAARQQAIAARQQAIAARPQINIIHNDQSRMTHCSPDYAGGMNCY